MAILDKISIIDNSIETMKEALSLPSSTPLEEVEAVISQGSITGPTNIYRAETEEDKDAIVDMVEGDICVVYGKKQVRSNGTSPLPYPILYFPETIDIRDVYGRVSSESSCSMGLGGLAGNKVKFAVGPTYYTVTEISTSNIIANYVSEDGTTYTRITEAETYDAGVNLKTGLMQYLRSPLYYFIYTQTDAFGLYQYNSNKWEYLNIKVDPDLHDIMDTVTIYTNNGYQKGTRNENEYRQDYIYVQENEPEEKTGLWVTYPEDNKYYDTAPYRRLTFLTGRDLDTINKAQVQTNFYTTTVKIPSTDVYNRFWGTGAKIAVDWNQTASTYTSNAAYRHVGFVLGDKLYTFPVSTTTDNKVRSLDIETGECNAAVSEVMPFTTTNAEYSYFYTKDEYVWAIFPTNSTVNYTVAKYNYVENIWTTVATIPKENFNHIENYEANYMRFVVGNYVYHYSYTDKKCYRNTLDDFNTLTEINLPTDFSSNITTDLLKSYYIDSNNQIWCATLCFDGETLELLSPSSTIKKNSYGTNEFSRLDDGYPVGVFEDGDNETITFVYADVSDPIYRFLTYNTTTKEMISNYRSRISRNIVLDRDRAVVFMDMEGNITWNGGTTYSSAYSFHKDKVTLSYSDMLNAPMVYGGEGVRSIIIQADSEKSEHSYRCEIAKGIYVYIKNVDDGDYTVRPIEHYYIGNGSKWNQIK